MNKLLKILIIVMIQAVLFVVATSAGYAQYCGGSVSCCGFYETVYTPDGCSNSCIPGSPGCVRCTGSSRQCGSTAGSGACSTWGSGGGNGTCFDNCTGIVESGGCSSYTPPPPTAAPQSTTTPPPGCEETNTCPEEPQDPPPNGYSCDQCGGCKLSPVGGSDYAACSASCVVYPQGSEYCPDPTTPAGQSSCPLVQELATEDITYPGQTRTWSTWAAPPGNSAAERLTNESPITMIQRSYTSPGDMLTISYVWQEEEGQTSSFYIYDKDDKTFYFYQGPNEPPVIFARNQTVVDNAVAAGYTQITDVGNNPSSIAAAEAVEKRVYKLSDWDEAGDIHPWQDGIGPAAVAHAPFGKSLNQVPFLNCASIFNASGHKHYYSTNITPLDDDKGYCFRRQRLRHGNNEVTWYDTETESNYTHAAGNYFQLENDLDAVVDGPIFGVDNSGDIIWPITGALSGPRWDYFDNFGWAFMETKSQYLQRPEDQNSNFTPAYMRNAVMQIPTRVFEKIGEHDLFVFIGMGGGGEPVPDENSDSGCMLSQDFNAETFMHVVQETKPPACDGFQVYDSSGVATDEIRLGQQYTARANAKLGSQIYSMYNSNFVAGFNATDTSQGTVDGWTATSDITYFKSVRCDIDSEVCSPPIPGETTDNRMLTISQMSDASGQSSETAYVESPYIETNSDLSGKTVTVEFWAKTDMPGDTLVSKMEVQRAPYTMPSTPFTEVSDAASDKLKLNFVGTTLGSTTNNFIVDGDWDKYIGTVTFPAIHPAGSKSTKLKLILRASGQGGEIHYDNFAIIGSRKPTVDFRMVRADQQCTFLSIGADSTSYNGGGLFTGLFNMSPSNVNGRYTDLLPGKYYLFARMDDPDSDIIYFGNLNSVANCGYSNPPWDDSIASTCMKELDLISCNEATPPTPTFVEPTLGEFAGKAYVTTPTLDELDEFKPDPTKITQMQLERIVATSTNVLHLAVTIPSNQATNVTEVVYKAYKMNHNGDKIPGEIISASGSLPSDGTQTRFEFDITPTVGTSNQLFIEVYTINGNSCADLNGLYSVSVDARIITMSTASGKVFNVPKNLIGNGTFDCRETTLQASTDGASQGGVTGTFRAYGVQDAAISGITDDTVFNTFVSGSPYAYEGGLGSSQFFLPHNPDNSAAWLNQMARLEFVLPPVNSQESFVCLDCNQKSKLEKNVCVYSNESDLWANYKTDSNFSEANFFATQANIVFDTSWWQTRGGLIGSVGKIDSDTPILDGDVSFNCDSDNDAYCQPFLNSKPMTVSGDYTTLTPEAGIPFTNNDTIDARTYVTQRASQSQAAVANTVNITEDYDHFRKLFKNPIQTYNTSAVWALQDMGSAEYASEGDSDMFVLSTEDSATPNLDLDLLGPINVPSGTKVIVFVEGDLNITGPSDTSLTNVNAGGFLMFIVQGDITVDSNIGHSTNLKETRTASSLEGIFLANDDIIIESKDNSPGAKPADNKFVAEGSFIALNKVSDSSPGIDMQRQFEEEGNVVSLELNSFSPTEMFIFRPDLIVNTPEILRRPGLTWKETN